MAKAEDFDSRKKKASSDLAATVPDIFASMAKENYLPAENTLMKLCGAGQLKFPGTWLELAKKGKKSSSISYRRQDSISAVLAIGPLPLGEHSEIQIKNLCLNEARTLEDVDLEGLRYALSGRHSPDECEISAGSIELLCHKNVLVIQGYFANEAMREALIIFPNNTGYGQLSLKSIKAEFPLYFNHLKQALKTIQWY